MLNFVVTARNVYDDIADVVVRCHHAKCCNLLATPPPPPNVKSALVTHTSLKKKKKENFAFMAIIVFPNQNESVFGDNTCLSQTPA